MIPTDLTKFRIEPERLSWRDKAASNALGLVGLALLTVLGFGVYGIWEWAKGLM